MEQKVNQNIIGLNLDAVSWQLKDNQITWALNANIQSHDGESVTYTNEPSNTACFDFQKNGLDGFEIVGYVNITEQSKVVLFLAHPDGRSRIGQITAINDSCLEAVVSESEDCGCANGKIIIGSSVQNTDLQQTPVYSCPEGYNFDSISGRCVREVYTIPARETVTYTCSPSSDNAWGRYGAVLYEPGWSPNGVGNFALLPTWWGNPTQQMLQRHVNKIAIRTFFDGKLVTNKWIGYEQTICIQATKTYYIGIAADNRFRVGLNGDYIIDPNTYDSNGRPIDTTSIPFVQQHLDAANGFHAFYRYHIYPIELPAGNHVLSLEYYDYGNPQMIAAEIYDTDFNTILNAQSIDEVYGSANQNLLFTTKGKTQLVKILSQSCPPGTTLQVDPDTCTEGCFQLESVPQTLEGEIPNQCCVYEDLVIDDCLDFCPGTCVEYLLGFRNALISIESGGVVTTSGTDYSTIEKYYSYIDCDGNEVTDFVLGELKRFRARKGTLKLDHPRLTVIQEVDVADSSQSSYSKENCCLKFDTAFPVHAEYRIDNCETKIYYASRNNPPRMFSVEHPYGQDACGKDRVCIKDSCEDSKLFPSFCQPEVHVTSVNSGGSLRAGVYSFAVAYADQEGNELTDYIDLTNPIPIYERPITEQVEYTTSKSINVKVLHNTRIFEYFNLVVAETVRTVTTYYLVNTFRVNQLSDEDEVVYTGDYKLPFTSITPIIRSPHYATANIIEKQNDILMLADLEETPKYNFQPFSSRLELFWETVEMPADGDFDYSNPEIAYFFRTFQRDEVYAFGIKFKLTNGKYSEVFHIPGRKPTTSDLESEIASTNKDVFLPSTDCTEVAELPRWRVYNTATVTEDSLNLDVDSGTKIEKQYNCKITSHKRGTFAYWESVEQYPCYEEIWEQSTDPNRPYYNPDALAGKPIRHHKFPDSAIVHIHDKGLVSGAKADTTIKNSYTSKMYPIGVRVNKIAMEALLNQKDGSGNYVYTVYDPILKKDIPIKDLICGFDLVVASRVGNKSVIAKGLMYDVGTFVDQTNGKKFYYSNYPYNDLRLDPYLRTKYDWYHESLHYKTNSEKNSFTWDAFSDVRANGNSRFTFYSPDTCFQFPKIGTELKLETIEFGHVLGHFVQVDEHPKHRIKKGEVYEDAGYLAALFGVNLSAETHKSFTVASLNTISELKFDQMMVAEQLILDIVDKLIPLTNHAWQFNSIATYNQYIPVGGINRKGNSRRLIDLGYYANEKIVEVYDDAPLHNRLRETSVYLKTTERFSPLEAQIVDNSRYLASSHGIAPTALQENRLTKAIYSSIKRDFPNQYGSLENLRYHTMGYSLSVSQDLQGNAYIQNKYYPAFGGDTFINKFALKRKHSFFTKNLVNLPARVDEYPYDYWLFPNLGYPTYYLGASNDPIETLDVVVALAKGVAAVGGILLASQLGAEAGFVVQYAAAALIMSGFNDIWQKFNVKVSFDDEGNFRYYRTGKFYTASYGIPIFFVESDVNIDLRHGRDLLKDNFYPNAGGGVPDDWLQEVNVPIKYDNFFYYDASFSVVNLSPNYAYRLKYPSLECLAYHQNRVIYSDSASRANFLTDPWRNYRPLNFYDFPKQGGKLIDLNAGDQDRVYARFENTTKVYNSRIVLETTSPYQLELGSPDTMFKQKPVDLKSTDTGYIGTQNRAYVRCEYGIFWVDAKRGHIYQLTGDSFNELKNEFNYNWFKENLPFQILKDLPEADVDSPSLGLGIVMGWDERFERVFITKLDYRVKPEYRSGDIKVVYDNERASSTFKKYLLSSNGTLVPIRLGDTRYFENKSWTVAYSPKMKNFISFYSFLPNFFIPQLGHFQTAINTPSGASLWNHNLTTLLYQTYYGKLYPYIIEYSVNSLPLNSQVNSVSLVADIQEYFNPYEYYSLGTANNNNLANFTKAIIYNKEQSSGIINLIPEKFGDKQQKIRYPRVTVGGVETLLSRRENKYTFNGFWNLAAQANGQPLWTNQWADIQSSYPIDKVPNSKSIRPVGVSFQKNKIKAEFTRIRLIQDKYNRYKFVNHIQINQLNNTNL